MKRHPAQITRTGRRAARLAVLFLLFLSLFLTACAGNFAPEPSSSAPASSIRVEVTVDCSLVLENPKTRQTAKDIVALLIERGHCDEKGVFFEGQLQLPLGKTAFDALLSTGLQVSYTSSSFGPFIHAINGLSDGDAGATSGWVYLVNGQAPTVSSGLYVLEDGDLIRWRYSVEESDLMESGS